MVEDPLRGFAAKGWSDAPAFSTLEKRPGVRERRPAPPPGRRVRFRDAAWRQVLVLLELRSAPDTRVRTALHYAAAGGAACNLGALLANGGGPGVKDHDGNTPLHIAAASSSCRPPGARTAR